MSKVKLAFIIGGLTAGGAERVVTTLANELTNQYDVVIITLNKEEPFYRLSSDIKVLHCNNTYTPSKSSFHAIISNGFIISKITQFIKAENISLLIGFTTKVNIVTILAAKYNKLPCIICERNNPHNVKLPFVWSLLRRKLYSKAVFLVVQTEEIKRYFVNSVKSQKLKILANPISQDLTSRRREFDNGEKIVLSVGRLISGKAQDQVIKAFAAINPKDWKLHIVGSGIKGIEYENLITKLGVQDSVQILPNTKRIDRHYNSASIFAFTSTSEGFPNALIEAMHFGLACVSTDCPTGPSELIINGDNGFLIPVNDLKALQKHLKLLINDENLRARLGKQAQESVSRYEVKNIVKQWEALINNALLTQT